MKRKLKRYAVIVLLTSITLASYSCKRCITCEAEGEMGFKEETTFCVSGINAGEQIRKFEKEFKEGRPDAICRKGD